MSDAYSELAASRPRPGSKGPPHHPAAIWTLSPIAPRTARMLQDEFGIDPSRYRRFCGMQRGAARCGTKTPNIASVSAIVRRYGFAIPAALR